MFSRCDSHMNEQSHCRVVHFASGYGFSACLSFVHSYSGHLEFEFGALVMGRSLLCLQRLSVCFLRTGHFARALRCAHSFAFSMRSRSSIRGCVRQSVRPSVRQSVRRSVTHELKSCKSAVFDQNVNASYAVYTALLDASF